ncbi:hypothetical protein ACQKWADRAFT_49308 [Trichoderma austrokoningii]
MKSPWLMIKLIASAQLSGVAQKVGVCLSSAPPSLFLSILRLVCLLVSPSLPRSSAFVCHPFPSTECCCCSKAQLGAQRLTLLDLCRYHLYGVQLASVVPHHLHRLRGPRFYEQRPMGRKRQNGRAGPFCPRAYQVSIASAAASRTRHDYYPTKGLPPVQQQQPPNRVSSAFSGLETEPSSRLVRCFSLSSIVMAANGIAGWHDGRQ